MVPLPNCVSGEKYAHRRKRGVEGVLGFCHELSGKAPHFFELDASDPLTHKKPPEDGSHRFCVLV